MEGGVTTIEQAWALPEIGSEIFETWIERQTDGTLLAKNRVRPLVSRPIGGDEILLFIDKDGRSMKVTYTENGPAKTEFRGCV